MPPYWTANIRYPLSRNNTLKSGFWHLPQGKHISERTIFEAKCFSSLQVLNTGVTIHGKEKWMQVIRKPSKVYGMVYLIMLTAFSNGKKKYSSSKVCVLIEFHYFHNNCMLMNQNLTQPSPCVICISRYWTSARVNKLPCNVFDFPL